MLAELAEVAAEPILDHAGYRPDEVFAYRLVSRRMLDVYNSSGRDIPHLVRKFTTNPAFMNPDDRGRRGLGQGRHHRDRLRPRPASWASSSRRPTWRRGVISMAHSWGDAPKFDSDVRTIGSNTGRLSSTDRDYDPVTGMPVMSAIPVNVRRSDENLALTR